ncbi:bifunctional pyr operon transcriptional regulator/uracil phosphoribosyltransferase PyrR [Alkalimarinus alittae]|uniref:Bifunctional pyr operon transcriptional regulator/uracil phosphoribosyltransferase PyrR n=1 Tax=Alkalimarinus alittae TaxID=2961619 RepID=A0ABY6N387_9ALTE|nr:bifunctional pyr operon transcriptional regulator/uracil phosphoribosyltransferase PyrR [Alkalimarinus alittae]UZE96543.1 bifunctional pyr operon transcriptional regulator/uracil phosphoribosyltransferase PyrR [Alkalimarinus alittae]
MTALLDVESLLVNICADLSEHLALNHIDSPCVIGIRTGGVWLADHIHKKLGLSEPFGELDISFYRDDFTRIGLNPTVKPSSLPFETEGRDIVLIDDVVMSGRTIRAAMNELFDYGRPASITLVSLIDLNGRELPIQPDIVGQKMTLNDNQQIKLKGPEKLELEVTEK